LNNDDDFNKGLMPGGREACHPFGKVRFSQEDFGGETGPKHGFIEGG
jgi:hypothetical protein